MEPNSDNNNPRALLDAVSAIYAAPGSRDGWDRMMSHLNALTGSKAGVYVLVNKADLSNEINAFAGFADSDVAAYQGPNGAAKDVRFSYLHNLLPGQVFREFEYVTDRAAWDASEWIQHQREALGCYWCMSALVSTHGLWRDYISVNRLESLGPHVEREKQNLQTLLPHIGRAAEIHRTLTSLAQRYGAVLSVLDRLMIGLVVLQSSGHIAVANATAKDICARTGALRITPAGRLQAPEPHQDGPLQRLIKQCIDTATATGLNPGGQVALMRSGCAVLAEILPLRDDGLPDGEAIRGAAVFLIDANLANVVSVSGLTRIFSLSPSESAVADGVANGLATNDIADLRGTSIETVRKQLKAVLAKTGTCSQLELLRLATKLTPPLRDRD